MIGIKEAVKKAFEHIEILYEKQPLPNKLLEEIEFNHDDNVWNVVIGFDSQKIIEKSEGPLMFQTVKTKENERKFKKIVMNGEDGTFIKMVDEMI